LAIHDFLCDSQQNGSSDGFNSNARSHIDARSKPKQGEHSDSGGSNFTYHLKSFLQRWRKSSVERSSENGTSQYYSGDQGGSGKFQFCESFDSLPEIQSPAHTFPIAKPVSLFQNSLCVSIWCVTV
jgi:hypothetical protein